VLRIFEENVKAGKGPAHEKSETAWAKMWTSQKYPGQSLAMKTIAGAPQAWFIEPHDSMASIEKLDKDIEKMTALSAQNDAMSAQEGDLLTGTRTMIAVYRPDLSYLPSNALPV